MRGAFSNGGEKMLVLQISIKGYTASFRSPASMNYQESLPFPPPTTITGIIGAATGKEYFEAQNYCRDLSFGVHIQENEGMAKDAWAIKKVKDGGRSIGKAVVIREVLYRPNIILLIVGPETKLKEIEKAISDPCFPLSLGRDDEFITFIQSELETAERVEKSVIHNTVVKGDLQGKINITALSEGSIPHFKTYWLNSEFDRDKRNPKARRPKNRSPYTYISEPVEYSGEAVDVSDTVFPLWR